MAQLFDTEKQAMSDADRVRMNGEHVKCQLELEAIKEEKRDVSSVYRVKIRELEEKIHTLASQLDEGEFEVRFEVVEIPDDARQMIAIQRKDTGREINVRPMTEAEKEASRKRRQGDLPFDEDGDTEPPPALHGVGNMRGSRKPKAKAKGKSGKR